MNAGVVGAVAPTLGNGRGEGRASLGDLADDPVVSGTLLDSRVARAYDAANGRSAKPVVMHNFTPNGARRRVSR
jgi:hypothetical protein